MSQTKAKFTIGHFPIIDHLVLGIAKYNDGPYFKNFVLKTALFYNWETMIGALRKKKIDGAFFLFPLAIELFRQGVPIKIVLLGQREGQICVASNTINDVRSLKGKTVLVPHRYSVHHIFMHRLLKGAGLDPQRDIVYMFGSPDIRDVPELLRRNSVAAFVSAEPFGTFACRMKAGKILATSRYVFPHHICCVFAIRDEIIETYPEACQELIDSLVKAGMFVSAYPRQAAEVGETFINCPRKILLEALTHHRGHVLFWDLLPRTGDFDALQRIAVDEMKLWPNAIDLTKLIHSNFAQHAYQEWMIDLRHKMHDKGKERVLPGSFSEAVVRFQTFFSKHIPVAGVKFIHSGERYPAHVTRGQQAFTVAFLDTVVQGKEHVALIAKKNIKGIAFLQASSVKEPDIVLMKLAEKQVKQCMRALHFGGTDFNMLQFDTKNLEEYLADGHIHGRTEPYLLHGGEEIWFLLNYQQFKFLVLLLHHF